MTTNNHGTDSSSLGNVFSMRIVNMDYYMATPIPGVDHTPQRAFPLPTLPIVRIFGATPAGQRACLHLHQIFPYFYVLLENDHLLTDPSTAMAFLHQFALGIEQAMEVSLTSKTTTAPDSNSANAPTHPQADAATVPASSTSRQRRQHIHGVSLVRAKPFYGYHSSERVFVKISLYNPSLVARASMLLQSGAVLGQKFQPHEAHIPYLLQVLVDHNLQGMAHIHLSRVLFRPPLPTSARSGAGYGPIVQALSTTPGGGIQLRYDDESDPWNGPPGFKHTQSPTATAGQTNKRLRRMHCVESPTTAASPQVPSSFPGGQPLRLWTEFSVSKQWVWTSESALGSMPGRHSTCELEVDGVGSDILNRNNVIRMPIDNAPDTMQLVQSLAPIWEEEIQRNGPPAAPQPTSARIGDGVINKDIAYKTAVEEAVRLETDIFSTHHKHEHAGTDSQGSGSLLQCTQLANSCGAVSNEHSLEVLCQEQEHGRCAANEAAVDEDLVLSVSQVVQDSPAPGDLHQLLDWLQECSSQQSSLCGTALLMKNSNTIHPSSDDISSRDAPNPVHVSASTQAGDETPPNSDVDSEVGSEEEDEAMQSPRGVKRSQPVALSQQDQLSRYMRASQLECQAILECSQPLPEASTSEHTTHPGGLKEKVTSHKAKPPLSPVAEDGVDLEDACTTQTEPILENNDMDPMDFALDILGEEASISSPRLLHPATTNPELNTNTGSPATPTVALASRRIFRSATKPPTSEYLMSTWAPCAVPKETTVPFYSNPRDVQAGAAVLVAGVPVHVSTRQLEDLPIHTYAYSLPADVRALRKLLPPTTSSRRFWISASKPPSRGATELWLGTRADVGGGGNFHEVSKERNADANAESRETRMDPNSGSLVVKADWSSGRKRGRRNGEHSDASDSDDDDYDPAAPGTGREEDPEVLERPQSPKYEEGYLGSLQFYGLDTQAGSVRPRPGKAICESPEAKLTDSGTTKSANTTPLSTSKLNPNRYQQETRASSKHVHSEPGSHLQTDKTKSRVSPKHPRKSPAARKLHADESQITPPSPETQTSTPISQSGFALGEHASQQLVIASIEIHAETRGDLRPDPRVDAVCAIVVCIHDDSADQAGESGAMLILVHAEPAHTSPAMQESESAPQSALHDEGTTANHLPDEAETQSTTSWSPKRLSKQPRQVIESIPGCSVVKFPSEADLLGAFTGVLKQADPDILIGYEVQSMSLGYLAERAAAALNIDLLCMISRVPEQQSAQSKLDDQYGRDHASGIHVDGRIVLNLWRLLQAEVKLPIYTFESCVAAILRLRVPHIPPRQMHLWFQSRDGVARWRCLEHCLLRARLNVRIVEQLDLVKRTSELARVFGIDFFSVISRGSQFRVESMMLRLAHTQNFLMLSPSRAQVADQPAAECLPLVMEPESQYYTSPVVVLDFQSLYPSMIIAYNLCFSTCLGRVPKHGSHVCVARKFGCSSLQMQPGELAKACKSKLTVTPNGVMFASPAHRKGVLPRLLNEILATRVMVKTSMKNAAADQRVLKRVLNARQFGLKLLANVTYGYTAAGFSGRMPCSELADAIVQCGRATLENAKEQIEDNPEWQAKVVYGDTDSLFVHLPGRSKEEAFRIGAEMAAAITAKNPSPVALKMEKVYLPCLLVTKKRYVGFSFESPSQKNPIFDAKGIETVRRDTCAAVAKTLERSIRILFNTHDLSLVKAYLQRQWSKIVKGRVSLQDFVFAKEVRLGTYSKNSPVVPPAAIVAGKAMVADPRAAPQYAERIPYVVVCGEPGARLVDMVVTPHALVENPSTLHLHVVYYITKQIIPALQRILGLAGADVRTWYTSMPRVLRFNSANRTAATGQAESLGMGQYLGTTTSGRGLQTMDQFYLSQHCAVCDALTTASRPVCSECIREPQATWTVLQGRSKQIERQHEHLIAVCVHCGGGDVQRGWPLATAQVACNSLDCPVFFLRKKGEHALLNTSGIINKYMDLLQTSVCAPTS